MEVKIGIVTGSRVDTNRDGTQPGRILQAIITDPKDVQNVQTCQGGEEFNPPRGCTVIIGAGGDAYKVQLNIDDGIAPAMDPGGKRIYATDGDGEAEVAEVRLHPDGKVELFNAEANITMLPDGTVSATNGAAGFTMSVDGHFTFHGVSSTFDHPVTMQQTLHVVGAVTSDLSVTAPNVTGTTNVTFAGKSAINHKHGGVQVGSGQTGVPA